MSKKRSNFNYSCENHSKALNPMWGVLFQTFCTTIEGDNKEQADLQNWTCQFELYRCYHGFSVQEKVKFPRLLRKPFTCREGYFLPFAWSKKEISRSKQNFRTELADLSFTGTITVLMSKKRSNFKDSCANHSRTLNPMWGVLFHPFCMTIEGDNKE